MARFLLVLKPLRPMAAPQLIEALSPLLEAIKAEVDHRTPAHLSALVRAGQDPLRMQLFADVQAKSDGPVLELALMSRESMGKGAPHTRQAFEQLLELAQRLPQMELGFRSDRDGAFPD
ncbi:MAG: hypothetical protein KGQ81_03545 [Cyanobacteria bacterium REEB498]|nr:hypothetical protein [Cyanobacteria bacterium REEB498]